MRKTNQGSLKIANFLTILIHVDEPNYTQNNVMYNEDQK